MPAKRKYAKIKKTKEKCFVCDKPLTGEEPGRCPTIIRPLYDGLWFRATGNFGSTIFDPIPDNGYIELAICDECVTKKAKQIVRVKNIRRGEVTAEVGKFNVRDDD